MKYEAVGIHKEWIKPSLPSAREFRVAIEEASFLEVKKAKDVCFIALGLEEKLKLVIENFKEWEMEMLGIAQSYLLWRRSNYDSMEHRLSLDRRLSNVLTSFRLYIDQTDRNISEIFGRSSEQLEHVKTFKNSLYDKYFGYRFFEAMRNLVQHCALPVQLITYTEKRDSQGEDNYNITIVPKMTLNDFDGVDSFKKSILEEVKSKGGKIDLRHPAREYLFCLVLLHKELRASLALAFEPARKVYMEAVTQYSKAGDYRLEHVHLQRLNSTGAVAEQVDLITEFLDIYDNLHKLNSSIPDIVKASVSNAI